MSTKSLKDLQNEFDNLFEFESNDEKWRIEAKVLVSRFLSLVEQKMDSEKISKKDLADKIDTSASFITQLFKGNKLPNLITLAKIQDVLNIKFHISLEKQNFNEYSDEEIARFLNTFYPDTDGNYIKIIKNPFNQKSKGNDILLKNDSLRLQA